MKIRIIVEFDLADAQGEPIEDQKRYASIAMDTVADVQNRLFGEGFLPSDLTVGGYTVAAEILLGLVGDE